MLINDLMNVQDIFAAWEDIEGDLNILFEAVEKTVDDEISLREEGRANLSDEEFEKLQELLDTLDAIPSIV